MRFINVRDLRLKPAEVWRLLDESNELVVTSSGRPFAILSGIRPEDIEETLEALRFARARAAVRRLRKQAAAAGKSGMDAAAIEAVVAEVRAGREPD